MRIQWIATSHSPQPHDPGRFLPHHKILEAYSLQKSKTQGLCVKHRGRKYNKSMDTILKTKDISDYAQECWLLQSQVSFQKSPGSQISMALGDCGQGLPREIWPAQGGSPENTECPPGQELRVDDLLIKQIHIHNLLLLFTTTKRKLHSPDTRIKGKLLSGEVPLIWNAEIKEINNIKAAWRK